MRKIKLFALVMVIVTSCRSSKIKTQLCDCVVSYSLNPIGNAIGVGFDFKRVYVTRNLWVDELLSKTIPRHGFVDTFVFLENTTQKVIGGKPTGYLSKKNFDRQITSYEFSGNINEETMDTLMWSYKPVRKDSFMGELVFVYERSRVIGSYIGTPLEYFFSPKFGFLKKETLMSYAWLEGENLEIQGNCKFLNKRSKNW